MAAILFVLPIILIFWFALKRDPTQRELGFWLFFLVPFALMIGSWFEGTGILDLWWAYLISWLFAGGVLFERRSAARFKVEFFDVDGVLVKVDKDGDEVFGVTPDGKPFPPIKAKVEGEALTEEEFRRRAAKAC